MSLLKQDGGGGHQEANMTCQGRFNLYCFITRFTVVNSELIEMTSKELIISLPEKHHQKGTGDKRLT